MELHFPPGTTLWQAILVVGVLIVLAAVAGPILLANWLLRPDESSR